MTKTERKALQDFMNKIQTVNDEKDYYFKKLQKLCFENGLQPCCCAKTNRDILLKAGVNDDYTNYLYDHYMELNGKRNLLDEYGTMLAQLNFWE